MSSAFTPQTRGSTKLTRYRQLAPRASLHVSPICLGGMSLGDQWTAHGFGAMDKASSMALLDAYFDAGGNFIDTASNYQNGASEEVIGEWAEARGVRDEIVIATKYTNHFKPTDPSVKNHVNFVGNNIKSLRLSVQSSLKRLRTSYIDLLYVHYWDQHTSVEEMMDGLHNLVVEGKILYLGASDFPAWLFMKANDYAKYNGKTPFVAFQGPYSVLQRDLERDIIPMCHTEGIALTLWNVLAMGHIRSDEEEERRRETGEVGRNSFAVDRLQGWERTDREKKICDALEVVKGQVGAKSITAVAIAYAMHKAPYVFPIIGGRKIEHLHSNIEALSISLSDNQMKYLEGILPFDKGFPWTVLGDWGAYPFLISRFAAFDRQPLVQPIQPSPD